MKNFIILLFITIIIGCNPVKNTPETKTINKPVLKEKKEIEYKEVILVLDSRQNNNLNDIVTTNNLVIKNVVADKNTFKAFVVKVPSSNLNALLEKLKNTNSFSVVEMNTTDALKRIENLAENTLINVVKTSCSGDCPVFEVTFFKDGNVTFIGKEYVSKKGITKFKINDKELKKLKNMFEKTVFKQFKTEKETAETKDFSDTFITYNDELIKVTIWRNIPDEIAYAYDYLTDLIYNKNLIE